MRSSNDDGSVKADRSKDNQLRRFLRKRRRKWQAWIRRAYVDGEGPPTPGGGGRQTLDDDEPGKITWKLRVRHFTFTWFTLTMATAGLAHVLRQVPLRFDGLYAIGCMFMIINICFFIANCTMMGLRFHWFPNTFKAAFLHPTESLFIPAFVLSLAQILINITEYGLSPGATGQWLLTTMTVFYWLYVTLAVVFSAGIYLLMWSTQTFTLATMTPIWIFPAYPLLLVGPFAGALSEALLNPDLPQPSITRLQILVGGVVCQGLGFSLSCMIYAAFIYRLMTHKLPAESTRPGMFVSVGPSGFTVSALIQMGAHFPTVVPDEFMGNGALAGQVTKIIAYWAGLWLYGLAVWFFLVSTFAHWNCVGGQRLTFAMTWYAFVFPNTSLITSTFNVARALGENKPLQIIGCVLTGFMIVIWSFIIGLNIRAIALKQVLWPQNGEDSEAHIFMDEGRKRGGREDGVAGGRVGAWATASRAVPSRRSKDEETRKVEDEYFDGPREGSMRMRKRANGKNSTIEGESRHKVSDILEQKDSDGSKTLTEHIPEMDVDDGDTEDQNVVIDDAVNTDGDGPSVPLPRQRDEEDGLRRLACR